MNARPPYRPRPAGQAAPQGVLVLGEALVDRFDTGAVAGGAPFNVARSLAAFGVPTTLITRIGERDEDGELVRQSARRFGLPEAGIQRDAERATGRVTIIERDGEHRFRIHDNAAWDAIDGAQAEPVARASGASIVYFGTLAQRGMASREAIRSLLADASRLRYLDLNLRDGYDNRELSAQSLTLADWVKVNEHELACLIVWFVPEADAAAAAGSLEQRTAIQKLMKRFALQRLIVTRGPEGYASFDAQGHCDATGAGEALSRVIDTVGAGDAFSAALLALHAARQPLPQALQGANRYAAALCGERGPIPEDNEFFRSWRWALGFDAVAATPR